MAQEDKDLLLNDLCGRLPYGVKVKFGDSKPAPLTVIEHDEFGWRIGSEDEFGGMITIIDNVKPYLFPLSSMTDEDYAIYSKIWEDTGKTAYLEGCHHLISTIKAYKDANNYLLSKHYDINGLIPKELANDATGLNIY